MNENKQGAAVGGVGSRRGLRRRMLLCVSTFFAGAAVVVALAGAEPALLAAQAQPVTAPQQPGTARPGAVQRRTPLLPRPGLPMMPGDPRLMLPARAGYGRQPRVIQTQPHPVQPSPQRTPLLFSPPRPTPPTVVVQPGSTAGTAEPALRVDYNAGLLTVSADKVLLSQVMQKVGERTGIDIRGVQEVSKPVSISFSGVPVAEGIRNLLGGSNYVVFGSLASPAEAKQARVILLSAATGAAVDVGPPAPSAGQTSDQRDARRADLMSQSPAEQDAGFNQLRTVSPKEAYDELEDVIVNGDGVARLRALQYMDQDDQLDRSLVLGTMRDALNDVDSSLRDYAIQALGRMNGPDALDLLKQQLTSGDANVRLNVIEALSQREDARPLIQQATQDPDQAVAGLATELLRASTPESQGQTPADIQEPGQPPQPPDAEATPQPEAPGDAEPPGGKPEAASN